MKFARWVVLVFVLAATLPWLPFDGYTTMYETRSDGAVPAGEVLPGFSLMQTVRPPAASRGYPHSPPCFAIKFATYARRNHGMLSVDWQQGERKQAWRIAFGQLDDNEYRHFCPDAGFDASKPFRLEIHGVEGRPGRSATFWLVDDNRFGGAETPSGQRLQGRSIALRGSAKHHVGPSNMFRIDHGAWVFGWLCSLVIGVVALFTGLAGGDDHGSSLPDWLSRRRSGFETSAG